MGWASGSVAAIHRKLEREALNRLVSACAKLEENVNAPHVRAVRAACSHWLKVQEESPVTLAPPGPPEGA